MPNTIDLARMRALEADYDRASKKLRGAAKAFGASEAIPVVVRVRFSDKSFSDVSAMLHCNYGTAGAVVELDSRPDKRTHIRLQWRRDEFCVRGKIFSGYQLPWSMIYDPAENPKVSAHA